MVPYFLTITSTGQIWVSSDPTFVPAGTVTQSFRISSLATSQLVCTLTGSGNSSASGLATTVGTSKKTGKGEGNEIH